MLLVYDECRNLHIMCCRGPRIESEDKGSDPEDFELPSTKGEGLGLRVYEVVPSFHDEYSEGYPTGYGEMSYGNGTYRRPSEREWNYIRDGNIKGLFEYWNDIISLTQQEERDEGISISGVEMMPVEEKKGP
jgi:hypothetical protein